MYCFVILSEKRKISSEESKSAIQRSVRIQSAMQGNQICGGGTDNVACVRRHVVMEDVLGLDNSGMEYLWTCRPERLASILGPDSHPYQVLPTLYSIHSAPGLAVKMLSILRKARLKDKELRILMLYASSLPSRVAA